MSSQTVCKLARPGYSCQIVRGEGSWVREKVGQGNKLVELVDTLGGGLVVQIKAGVIRKEVTLKGEDEQEEERGLALSYIDVLAGDNGLDVGIQLVMEGMAEWEVRTVEEEDVMEGYEGAVRKVVKYPLQSKSGENDKDPKMNISAATDAMDNSCYLQLLAIQEDNMKRLVEVVNGKEDDEKDKDREAKAKQGREG